MFGYLRCLRRSWRNLGFLLLGALSSATAEAQTVWRVDGNQFSDVASAYAVARPGDVILVSLPGTYLTSLSGKGVRILAAAPGTTLDVSSAFISGIPRGEQLILSGFQLMCAPGFFNFGCWFMSSPGSIVLEHCTGVAIAPYSGPTTLYFRDCDDVQLFDCIWLCRWNFCIQSIHCGCAAGSGTTAIDFDRCVATVVRCQAEGGPGGGCPWGCLQCGGQQVSYPGGAGIMARSSRLSVHESRLAGGRPGGSSGGSAPGLWISATELWVTSSTINEISGDSGSVVRYFGARPQIGGTPRSIAAGPSLPRFQASLANASLTIRAQWANPGAPLYFGASLASGFAPLDPYGAFGVLEMDYATSRSLLLGMGNFDASGNYVASLPIPAVTMQALRFQDFRLQLLTLDTSGTIAASGVDFLVMPG
jgi:hypothetical protein